MQMINLFSNTTRVETPYIKVVIGDYTFGVFGKVTSQGFDSKGVYSINKIKYPSYLRSLQVEKLNGSVNKYTLRFSYPITEADDPNFFYKVFSSVSKTRKIVFSYGDLSAPTFCFRDEEAFILSVKDNLNPNSPIIDYTLTAISNGVLVKNGAFDFTSSEWVGKHKASTLIKKLLFTKMYGLQEVFYGMNNKQLVDREGLIFSNDIEVNIEAQTNISSLDYLMYLVSCMRASKSSSLTTASSIFTLVVMDDFGGKFMGPYFKVVQVKSAKDVPLAYEIDFGYPSQNIITQLTVDNDDSYALFYNFYEKLNSDQYVQRINDRGELVEVYAPILGSNAGLRKATEAEKSWWSTVTQYPIKLRMTIKGLLKPAILMSYVRINIIYYGKQYVHSGLYIVTKQVDNIDDSGYRTTLSLLRVGKAEELEFA